MIAQREVDPAPLEGWHRLELEHLAGFLDASRRPIGDVPKLALAPAAVVLDVDEDPCPFAHPPRQHQVDEVLQRREALALSPDESAECVVRVAVANDVEAARVARLDLDPNVKSEVPHQLLEDLATGGEGLRGCLGGLEIGSLCRNGTSRGGNLGRLICVQCGWARRSIVDVNLRQRYGVIVVGIQREDRRMEFNPEPDTLIHPGDKLVVLGRPDSLKRLETDAAGAKS